LEREVTIPFEEGGFFFTIFALQNYSEKESVLLVKFHHSLADGMGLIGLCASLQDEYNHDQLYEFAPKLNWCQFAGMIITLPFTVA
jgi:NRPS condensation-like uncharacterized protein